MTPPWLYVGFEVDPTPTQAGALLTWSRGFQAPAPIHVTSIINGNLAGHNCWYVDCDGRQEEHVFGVARQPGVEIGGRYWFDTFCNVVCPTMIQPAWKPCRQTRVEPCGFKLGKMRARCAP